MTRVQLVLCETVLAIDLLRQLTFYPWLPKQLLKTVDKFSKWTMMHLKIYKILSLTNGAVFVYHACIFWKLPFWTEYINLNMTTVQIVQSVLPILITGMWAVIELMKCFVRVSSVYIYIYT